MLKHILMAVSLAAMFTAQAQEPDSQALEEYYRAQKLKVYREMQSRPQPAITETEEFKQADPQIKRGMEALKKKAETGWSFQWNGTRTRIGALSGIIPLSKSSKISDPPEKIAIDFLKENHELFQMNPDLVDLRVESAKEEGGIDNYVIRLRQTFNGLPVLNGHVKISINEKKEIYMLHNYYVPNINISTIPRLSEDDVIAIAKNDVLQNYMYETDKSGRKPYSGQVVYDQKKPELKLGIFNFHETPVLVYNFRLFIWKPIMHLYYIVNTNTGEIIESQNTIVYD